MDQQPSQVAGVVCGILVLPSKRGTHVSATPAVNSQSCMREKGSLASGTAAVQMATMSGTQGGCTNGGRHQQEQQRQQAAYTMPHIALPKPCLYVPTHGVPYQPTCMSAGTTGMCLPVNKNASSTPKLYTSHIWDT